MSHPLPCGFEHRPELGRRVEHDDRAGPGQERRDRTRRLERSRARDHQRMCGFFDAGINQQRRPPALAPCRRIARAEWPARLARIIGLADHDPAKGRVGPRPQLLRFRLQRPARMTVVVGCRADRGCHRALWGRRVPAKFRARNLAAAIPETPGGEERQDRRRHAAAFEPSVHDRIVGIVKGIEPPLPERMREGALQPGSDQEQYRGEHRKNGEIKTGAGQQPHGARHHRQPWRPAIDPAVVTIENDPDRDQRHHRGRHGAHHQPRTQHGILGKVPIGVEPPLPVGMRERGGEPGSL